ncbi:PD-(D/E)XK nuclease family protein [uncultured Campylobacter sp.]|uniref:PDDEXK-like family protein n=1 Tax=uncultured Campylobacter sp. TaxID=218934 RepID=UPI0028EDF3C9|nr:PD-(D/E)XK nuclease family protein [uncultured Campylobacter sp.]
MEIKLQKEGFEKLFAAMGKGYMAAKAQADRQRAMGRHDYNIFTLFYNFSDEVNLHSNFIASLLDPNGDHYKGDLFLKLFLETCGIDDFSIDTSRATVFKEFKHIDIYISDGKKHIILENKVYAKDQNKQIERYIDTIKTDKTEGAKDDDIYVLYLHPDGELPKEYSLGDYKTDQNITKLVKEGSTINFKVISYCKEIVEWIDKCKNEVSNLTDLNVFLSQYKDVIEMIYNRYKRIDKMANANLVEIFKENYAAVSEIVNNYQEVRKKIIYSFFSNAAKILRGDSEIKSVYDIKTEENQDYRPIIITKKNPKDGEIWEKFYFTVEFQKSPYSMPYVGFRRKEDKNTNAKNYKKPCEDQLKKQTEYFLAVDELYKDVNTDICKKIIEEEFKPETFAEMTNAILIKLKEQKLEMQTNQN